MLFKPFSVRGEPHHLHARARIHLLEWRGCAPHYLRLHNATVQKRTCETCDVLFLARLQALVPAQESALAHSIVIQVRSDDVKVRNGVVWAHNGEVLARNGNVQVRNSVVQARDSVFVSAVRLLPILSTCNLVRFQNK